VALAGILWMMTSLNQPMNIILLTDSDIVYHSFVKGSGLTPRSSEILKNLYIQMYINKQNLGHGVVRWVPSAGTTGGRVSSFKVMKMFAILDKAKPGTENTRGLNLAAVRRTTVQVTRMPL
jgi:hypothetical protein